MLATCALIVWAVLSQESVPGPSDEDAATECARLTDYRQGEHVELADVVVRGGPMVWWVQGDSPSGSWSCELHYLNWGWWGTAVEAP